MKNTRDTTCKTLSCCALALAALLGLSACSKDDKAGASQVAAKINSQEISVHQVNFVLSRSGANATTPEQIAALRKAALERLIDQQLAVDEALEKKLDRQPDVVMALDLARREVLARALLEQMAAAAPKTSEDEAKKYYKDNPALFAERRIFSVQELIVPAAAGALPQIKEMLAAGKNLEEIAAYLKSRNIQFGGGAAQRTAEQIPLEILPRVHALKDGQSTIVETPQAATVVRVAQSQAQPVTEAQAIPRIQQFLANQRNNAAAVAEIKRLKEKAKISYVGDFAAGAAAPAAPAAPAAAPAATVTAPASPAQSTDSSMEKGVRGLK
jgi:EpsD family peptidyl-prolyl cis-trans isomerase